MGSFGGTVASLLDTYTKCLSLLKGLRQEGKPSGSQTRLGSSIRSDRAKVRRVYSSRLSSKGASFEKGDSTARSSLKRIIRKLTRTLEKLMRTVTRSQRDPVDYASLMSLSNKSRQDAIRTMSDLSSRVSSGSSARSTKSKKGGRVPRPRDSVAKNKNKKRETRAASADRGHSPAAAGDISRDKRFSMLTTSSGSTKLGEVRRNRNADQAVYSSRVIYPLEPYAPHRAKEPKKWWGLFSR